MNIKFIKSMLIKICQGAYSIIMYLSHSYKCNNSFYHFKWAESCVWASKKQTETLHLLGNLAKLQKPISPLSRVICVRSIIKAYRVAFFLWMNFLLCALSEALSISHFETFQIQYQLTHFVQKILLRLGTKNKIERGWKGAEHLMKFLLFYACRTWEIVINYHNIRPFKITKYRNE